MKVFTHVTFEAKVWIFKSLFDKGFLTKNVLITLKAEENTFKETH